MTVAPSFDFPPGHPGWPWGAWAELARLIYGVGGDPSPVSDDAAQVERFAAFLHGVNAPAPKVAR